MFTDLGWIQGVEIDEERRSKMDGKTPKPLKPHGVLKEHLKQIAIFVRKILFPENCSHLTPLSFPLSHFQHSFFLKYFLSWMECLNCSLSGFAIWCLNVDNFDIFFPIRLIYGNAPFYFLWHESVWHFISFLQSCNLHFHVSL
jgi:hypothetical protein